MGHRSQGVGVAGGPVAPPESQPDSPAPGFSETGRTGALPRVCPCGGAVPVWFGRHGGPGYAPALEVLGRGTPDAGVPLLLVGYRVVGSMVKFADPCSVAPMSRTGSSGAEGPDTRDGGRKRSGAVAPPHIRQLSLGHVPEPGYGRLLGTRRLGPLTELGELGELGGVLRQRMQ